MSDQRKERNFTSTALGILLLLVALNAFGGGYYGLSGAKGVPLEWLRGSPFKDYFIPSLFLFIVVGLSALLAGILVLLGHPWSRIISLICGILIALWIAVQVFMIGYVSWMQPTTAIAAAIILVLAWKLPKKGQ